MSTTPVTQDTFNVDRKEAIHLAPRAFERRYAIRLADWNRLKNNIINLSQRKPYKCSIWYSILFGISGSFGVSLIPVLYSSALPGWVAPLYGCVSFFSLILAICLMIIEKWLNTSNESSLSSIVQDIHDIEKPFPSELSEEQQAGAAIYTGAPSGPAAQE